MKKVLLAMLLIVCFTMSFALVACDNGERLNIYVPDGAPAMAIANIIDSGKVANYKTDVIVTTGEDVVAKCANGEADIAIVPTNAAVKICATDNKYSLFTVNVWGLLYVIGWENITSLSQLNGKKVSSIGLANTGEYLFKRLLDDADVSYDDNNGVQLDYVEEGSTAIGYLTENKCDFALVGEPLATTAINNAKANGKTLYRVFDLQQLWQEVTDNNEIGYPQASVIVKKTLLSQDGFAEALYNMLSQNNAFLSQNVNRLNDILISAGSSLKAPFTAELIERCNLRTVKATEVKQDILSYLSQFNGPFAGMLKDELYYEFQN
ncbi:MAG: hypothetical protein K2M64_04260 [Clostridia bacterium]|nr:hypothetical protein [Clostridia bacterium]